MAKIYIARKNLFELAEHTYWVYDPDGNPYSGDERIIRGGTVVLGQFGGDYLIEVDRPIAQSRDSLNGEDPFTDRYYTTIFSSEDGSLSEQEVTDLWNAQVNKAKDVGIETVDPWAGNQDITIPPGTSSWLLPENDYLVFSPNCNCLTSTVGDAVGIVAAENLPKINGDLGNEGRISNDYGVMGIDSLLVGVGDNLVDLTANSNRIFDQGGNDTYRYDFVVNGRPNERIVIVEDDISGTADRFEIYGVNPEDLVIRTDQYGNLNIYLPGNNTFTADFLILNHFDDGFPKVNNLWVYPAGGSAPTVISLNNPEDFQGLDIEIPPWIEGALGTLVGTLGVDFSPGASFGGGDPLTLDLDGDGQIELTSVANGVHYDFWNDGFAEKTGWVGADDGMLVWDKNSDGNIEGFGEMIASASPLSFLLEGDWTEFRDELHGFAQLALLDDNGDGIIDAQDTIYTTLQVWQDINQNGISETGELHSLADLNIANDNWQVSERLPVRRMAA